MSDESAPEAGDFEAYESHDQVAGSRRRLGDGKDVGELGGREPVLDFDRVTRHFRNDAVASPDGEDR